MMSFDGQYFMYTGTTDEGSQVLSYDRIAGTTTEMLAPDGSLPDNAGCTNLASTGQYNVVGCTSDNIVADICCTVYLWDQSTNTFEDLERSTDGGEGIPAGYNDASISPDGRYVAFVSLATDLVPGGTSGQQVFMYDRQTGVTQLVSAAADGTQGNATNDEQGHGRVTPDGRFVLFNSNATNLVGDVNNTGLLQLYLKDLQTGDIQEISVASDGTPGDSNSTMPAISADAAYVYSRATTAI
jgi:hypothetical protein